MPAGDPAGYLPNVKRSRRYKPRARQRLRQVRPSTTVKQALDAPGIGGFLQSGQRNIGAGMQAPRVRKRRTKVRTMPAGAAARRRRGSF